jgi:hypothetical protein
LEKHLDGLADERFVVHDQYVSLLASAFVHHGHKSAISVPVLLFFYRLAWASAIAFGYVAVSRFGKTNVPPTTRQPTAWGNAFYAAKSAPPVGLASR